MKTIKKYLFLVASLSIVISCNSTKITKRYKKFSSEPTSNIDQYVKVQAFAFDVKGVKSNKSIFDLSPRGQEALVEEIGDKEATSKAIYNQLSKQFVVPSKPVTEVDKTKFKKRLVFSIEDLKNQNGANRLDWIKIKVGIPKNLQPNLRFVYWDKIITEYQEIDLGKISSSRTNTSGAAPSFGINTELITVGIDGNFSTSKTTAEELQLKQKIAKVYGSLSEESLYIAIQSAPLQNLSGNIILELFFEGIGKVAPDLVYDFKTKDAAGNYIANGSDVIVKKMIYQHSNLAYATTELELTYEARYRSVKKGRGAKTFMEGDDVVTMFDGVQSNPTKFKLLDRDDLNRKFWFVQHSGFKLALKNNITGSLETIQFDSYKKAKNFLSWLQNTNSTDVKGYDVYKSSTTKLLAVDVASLLIGVK
jgi:hypothetical protein